jgi:hypothetical protein
VSSFDDLVTLVEAAGNAGSGWLTREPHEGADAVRTDAVVVFQPHRHFPIGADQAWVDVSFGGMMMAIPLSAVVSYRPDAEVRQRWENLFSSLTSGTDEPDSTDR